MHQRVIELVRFVGREYQGIFKGVYSFGGNGYVMDAYISLFDIVCCNQFSISIFSSTFGDCFCVWTTPWIKVCYWSFSLAPLTGKGSSSYGFSLKVFLDCSKVRGSLYGKGETFLLRDPLN